ARPGQTIWVSRFIFYPHARRCRERVWRRPSSRLLSRGPQMGGLCCPGGVRHLAPPRGKLRRLPSSGQVEPPHFCPSERPGGGLHHFLRQPHPLCDLEEPRGG